MQSQCISPPAHPKYQVQTGPCLSDIPAGASIESPAYRRGGSAAIPDAASCQAAWPAPPHPHSHRPASARELQLPQQHPGTPCATPRLYVCNAFHKPGCPIITLLPLPCASSRATWSRHKVPSLLWSSATVGSLSVLFQLTCQLDE